MSWFKTPPKLLASDSCVEAMFDKAFTEVMGDLKPGRVFRTPLPVQPVRLNPARQEPPPAVVELAGQVLLKLIDQADSIVADPADLTKRAWDIANEFAKRYEENCR